MIVSKLTYRQGFVKTTHQKLTNTWTKLDQKLHKLCTMPSKPVSRLINSGQQRAKGGERGFASFPGGSTG
jgi:hypothetical protein